MPSWVTHAPALNWGVQDASVVCVWKDGLCTPKATQVSESRACSANRTMSDRQNARIIARRVDLTHERCRFWVWWGSHSRDQNYRHKIGAWYLDRSVFGPEPDQFSPFEKPMHQRAVRNIRFPESWIYVEKGGVTSERGEAGRKEAIKYEGWDQLW